MEQAERGIATLKENVDALVVIQNERLRLASETKITLLNAFVEADNVLKHGVQSISDLIYTPGLINLDFEDVCQIMRGAGSAHMGVGRASGKDKAESQQKQQSLPTARIFHRWCRKSYPQHTAPSDIELDEVNLAADMIRACAHPDVNLIFGVAFDDTLDDEMVVTVIATGFELDKNFDIPDYRFKAASSTDTSKKEEKEENDSYKQPDDDDMPFDIMSIFGQRR